MSAGVISSERSTPVVTRKKTGKKEKQQIYIKTEGKKEAGERERKGRRKYYFVPKSAINV